MQNRLAEIRKSKGLSQEKLAEISGVSRVTIANIETGRNANTTSATMIRIAEALDSTVGSIFFGEKV